MNNLHIYPAKHQLATRFVDRCGPKPMWFRLPPLKLLRCYNCEQIRRAKNCVVQVYYDGLIIWCAPGHGCKDPKVIAAKARAMFRRRSEGQKTRKR